MKEILLTKGFVALVDDIDFERLSQWKWSAQVLPCGRVIAVRNHKRNRKSKLILMHRQILEAPSDYEVDHVNGNTLDNRRENLRLATHKQNMMNTRLRTDSSSGYKGVSWDGSRGKWAARIYFDGKLHWLGRYDNPVVAARVYDEAALELHGRFACTNERLGLL